MKIEKDQHIKILFKNGMVTEGIVDSWELDNYIIRSLTDQSLLIIFHPNDDILAVKVLQQPVNNQINSTSQVLPKINSTSPILPKVDPEVVQEELGAEKLTEQDLRVKKLAELRILEAKQAKAIFANKLKDHNIGPTNPVQYKQPFIKK